MITTSQALLEETRFGCVTKTSYMHSNISKLRNCHNSCASSHRPIFDSNGQAWFGVGAGAGDTYIGRRLTRTNAASANDYGVYNNTSFVTQHLCRLPCTYVLYKTFTCTYSFSIYVRMYIISYVRSRLQISEPLHPWLGQLCMHCLTWDLKTSQSSQTRQSSSRTNFPASALGNVTQGRSNDLDVY